MADAVQISTREENGIVILDLAGRVDAATSPELENALSSLISSGNNKIVLNATGLVYISSSGLRILLASLKKLKADNGDLVLACLQPAPREVVTMTGFNRLFCICDTIEDGIHRFS